MIYFASYGHRLVSYFFLKEALMKKSGMMLTVCVCFFMLSLLLFPEEMTSAALRGLSLWLCRVVPSLFPFLTACGVLFRLGAAERAGRCFQPFMRPLFGLSGISAFPFFLGALSGYPMGAKLTASLYEKGLLSLEEARHTLFFSNLAGPLFLVGTVGTSFFGLPAAGYLLLLSSFLGAVCTGLFYRTKKRRVFPSSCFPRSASLSPMHALSASVSDAVETILQIGGFLILFSVLTEALETCAVFSLLSAVFSFLPLSPSFIKGFFCGLLEMTNGCALLSASPDALRLRLAVASFLTSFGGLSVLGQTFSVIPSLPVSKKEYLFAKLLHAVFSSGFCLFFCGFVLPASKKAVPVCTLSAGTALPSSYFCFCLFLLGTLLPFFKRKDS